MFKQRVIVIAGGDMVPWLPWLLGCSSPELTLPEAEVTRAPGELPARFRADVPEVWDATAPPQGRLHHQLCTGKPGVREAVAARLAAGAVGYEAVVSLSCDSEAFCGWLLDQPSPWWSALSSCEGERYEARLDADAPPGVLLAHAMDTGRVSPRVREVALVQLREARDKPELASAAWLALAALGAGVGGASTEEAEAGLVEAYPLLGEELRLSLPSYLREARTDRGRRLEDELCRQTQDPICQLAPPDPLQDLETAMLYGLDPEDLAELHPNHGKAVSESLSRCASGDQPTHARRCLLALARLDRQAAAALVAGLDSDSMGDLQELLAQDRAEVLAELQRLGLPHEVPPDSEAVTVPELLLEAGAALRIAPIEETGPLGDADHVRLLYAMAELAGLTDVEFDQWVPGPEAPRVEGRELWLTLLAWRGGARYRTLSPLEGAPAVAAGLVNTLLEASGAPRRLALSEGIVVAGTPEQLGALQRWVRFEGPSPPMDPDPAMDLE
jgi:hypothetical protein